MGALNQTIRLVGAASLLAYLAFISTLMSSAGTGDALFFATIFGFLGLLTFLPSLVPGRLSGAGLKVLGLIGLILGLGLLYGAYQVLATEPTSINPELEGSYSLMGVLLLLMGVNGLLLFAKYVTE